MNIFDYIKNYCAAHDIENYTLKDKFVTKSQVSERLQFSGSIAFFYKVLAEGEITDVANLQNKVLEAETPTDFWDLSPAMEIVDFGTIQKVCSNFIFTADNTLNFKLYEGTADAMFANINNFCAQYICVTPLPSVSSAEPRAKASGDNTVVKVKVNY